MKLKFVPFFLLVSVYAFAQQKTTMATKTKSISFPESFIGHWKGTLNWYPNGGEAKQVETQLIIKPTSTKNEYTWQIIYGAALQDNRPYLLKKKDTTGNHWLIDEVNGIVLDSYWLGNRFIGAFSVSGNMIVDNYWLQNDELHIEFISHNQNAISTSGGKDEDNPTVNSYRLGSYQKGVLKRIITK